MSYEWDEAKARSNLRKHRVSFEEAVTVFGDWRSLTIADPGHSAAKIGFSSWELLHAIACWLCPTWNAATISASSALVGQVPASVARMPKKSSAADELRPEYDFSGGVRGKYAARYAEGTNVVVLTPDVAKVFPDSASVNEALRTLVRLSGKTVRQKRPRSKRSV